MAKKKENNTKVSASTKRFSIPKNWLDYTFFALLSMTFFFLVGFVQLKHQEQVVMKVEADVSVDFDNHFVEAADVLRAMTLENSLTIVGKKYKDIDLKSLEERVESIKFVEDAQVSADHKGTLMVEVKQSKPIARIVQPYGPHAYIGSNAATLSTSDKFTARVLIVEGANTKQMLSNSYFLSDTLGRQYFNLFQFIHNQEFWRAMIAQCTLLNNGDVVLLPQVGDYTIQFGKPTDLEEKFRKIEIFYKDILPSKGWDRYHSVNVKFKDQLICE
ncbi:MAG: cell division protein [Cytophagaceae bacterium]|jgi:cell division protein FtsQ|nr:cell division protein [Cytophagaceae bacterium]